MKKYFISLNGQQTGPYTVEELQAMSLTSKYLVWTDGFNGWKSILSIQELNDSIIKLPPIINNNKVIKEHQDTYFKRALIIGLVISIILYSYVGGFDNEHDLLEKYYGEKYLDNYNIGEKVASQTRLFIAGLSLLQGILISSVIYFLAMMLTYKKAYKKDKV